MFTSTNAPCREQLWKIQKTCKLKLVKRYKDPTGRVRVVPYSVLSEYIHILKDMGMYQNEVPFFGYYMVPFFGYYMFLRDAHLILTMDILP